MGEACFSPATLAIVTAIVTALFGYLMYVMNDSIREARAERDRMADGWEQTIGLGEKVVRRERRRP